MNVSKKILEKLGIPITLGVVCLGFLVIHFWHNQAHAIEPEISNKPKVTQEDTKPIIIPEEVIKRGKTIKLPILMYHHVDFEPQQKWDRVRIGLTVSPENFEQQVNWIKKQGYHSVSLNDIYLFAEGKKSLPKKPIVFTFDDGYDDVFNNAIPILQKYGYMGSFAIITNYPGITQGTNIYANWDSIKAAQAAGMEIVCHTENHFDGSNPKFTADYIFNNLSGCTQTLVSHGINSNILIYPYGHYTSMYIEQAKKAGFVMGLTVHEGNLLNLEDLMQLPRVRVNAKEPLDTLIKYITH